jgi:hypothetical protein
MSNVRTDPRDYDVTAVGSPPWDVAAAYLAKSNCMKLYTPDVIMQSGVFACVAQAEEHAARPGENR